MCGQGVARHQKFLTRLKSGEQQAILVARFASAAPQFEVVAISNVDGAWWTWDEIPRNHCKCKDLSGLKKAAIDYGPSSGKGDLTKPRKLLNPELSNET